MDKKTLAVMADFARKTYQDAAKDPREDTDVHMARCNLEGFIMAMKQLGKDIILVDKESSTKLESAFNK